MWTPRKSVLLLARSWTRHRRTTASRSPKIECTPEELHAVGYLWLNVRGTYLRQHLLAQPLHRAARRPKILIVAKAKSRASPEVPPFLDYGRYIVLSAHGSAGLDVYVRAGTTTRATLLRGREGANTLLIEVLTLGGKTTC